MATPNPLANAYPKPPTPVSKKTYCVAGVLTTVYGLKELRGNLERVACLWLLHPRLQTEHCMEPIACSVINSWNAVVRNTKDGVALIAVTFDQRNHGTREVDPLGNQDWRSGNPRHAQDMFANYHGTATDTSHLLNHISSYIFPDSKHAIEMNLVCGVSLGGHAAWQCLMLDPRISAAISIVGCPDYISLMTDRARLTKLATWTHSSPPGISFLGSSDFPPNLVEAVAKYDPAGAILGVDAATRQALYTNECTEVEKEHSLRAMKMHFQGKRMLNMSGSADKLVPYRCGEGFLGWLKRISSPSGLFAGGDFMLRDLVFENVGHAMSLDMAKELDTFIMEVLKERQQQISSKSSKI